MFLSVILLFGVAARLLIALLPSDNFDLQSYEIVRGIILSGGNVYAETFRYNYSPVWGYILAIGIAPRLLLAVVDSINIFLVYRAMGKGAAIAYALNPGALVINSVHGQFEALALMPILLTLAYKRFTFLAGAAAILIKHNTLFLVWALWVSRVGPKRAAWWTVAAVALFALSFAPFLPTGLDGIVSNVLRYGGVGSWGLSNFIPRGVVYALMLTVMIGLPIVIRLSDVRAVGLAALMWLITIPGIGLQYFALAYPFLGLWGVFLGLTVASMFILSMYTADISIWLLCCALALKLIISRKRPVATVDHIKSKTASQST
jgi:hypothetical protein